MRTLDPREISELKKMLARRKPKGIPKLRAAIYARKSAEDEKDTSIPTQIHTCERFIQSFDFITVIHKFSEDNASGMFTAGRSQYLEMMTLAEKQEIDVIVVMKLDRLSRDLADSTTAVKLLKAYDCYLIAGDDVSNPNTPDGEFMRSILLAQSQFHARRVASDVMATECKNATDGLSAGGIAPYGLKLINQHFEIDEAEAPAVKLLFELYNKGYSYKGIITKLTELGYRTRAGNKFSYSTIHDMLKNDKYYGTYVYNREGSPRKKNRVLNEHFDEVRNATAIPPIITKEAFDQANASINERKKCRPKQDSSPEFVLTGLIKCKCCGKSMSGLSNICGRNKIRRRTYCCPNHQARNGKTCTTKPINAEYLENLVKDILTKSINTYTITIPKSTFSQSLNSKLTDEIAILSRHISDTENKAKKFLDKSVSASSPMLSKKYENQAEEYFTYAENSKVKLLRLKAELEYINSCFENDFEFKADEIFASYETARELAKIFIKSIEIDTVNDDIILIFND